VGKNIRNVAGKLRIIQNNADCTQTAIAEMISRMNYGNKDAIDISNPYTLCSSTLRFFDIILDFKISPDKHIPEVSGTCFSGQHISLLDFIDKDLLEIEYYMS